MPSADPGVDGGDGSRTMRFLAYLLAGVILGYFAGVHVGRWKAAEDLGWMVFLYRNAYIEYFASRGAVGGGIIGALVYVTRSR